MFKDLQDNLAKVQKALVQSSELGRKRMEELAQQSMEAFDRAIRSIDFKVNVRQELEKNRQVLRQWRIGFFKSIFPINLRYLLSMPFIYGMIVPALFLHLCLEIYQQVCFRLYGVPRVKARDYFVLDRALLPYLNWLEKLNCVYCSYVNNLFQFAVEIGGRTERYWCPIKYANRVHRSHGHYDKFVDFMDAENFREKWVRLRDFSDLEPRETPPAVCKDPSDRKSSGSS